MQHSNIMSRIKICISKIDENSVQLTALLENKQINHNLYNFIEFINKEHVTGTIDTYVLTLHKSPPKDSLLGKGMDFLDYGSKRMKIRREVYNDSSAIMQEMENLLEAISIGINILAKGTGEEFKNCKLYKELCETFPDFENTFYCEDNE